MTGSLILGLGSVTVTAQNLLSQSRTFTSTSGEAAPESLPTSLLGGSYSVSITAILTGTASSAEAVAFQLSNTELVFSSVTFPASSFVPNQSSTFSQTISFQDPMNTWSLDASALGDTWTPNFSLEITSITLTAIPEPSTYAAVAGGVALGFAVWRRRRGRA